MEISAAGRLKVHITTADVGKRVSVRQSIEDGRAGEKFTDTVGVLTSWDGGVLLITRRGGESVRIPESLLVAGKVVPAAPARRRGPSASYEELARVAARAWRPVESERLGGWELRAASGFTRRANSVLPLGDPGVPMDEALTRVRDWYAARGLPAYVQTATGAEGTQEPLCAELEARGWTREVTAELWTGPLAPLADRAAPDVGLSRTADAAWLGRYQRKGLSDVALEVLGGGPSVWFATVPGAAGEAPAAIGRCVVDGRWAGFAAVEVDPAHRRRGLATAVMAALAGRALDEGASAAWLQVEADNTGARALYAGLGFAPHHAYHHYRAPHPPDEPDAPGGPDAPSAPGGPGAPGAPDTPSGPGDPDTPSGPGGPSDPGDPGGPGDDSAPDTPPTPGDAATHSALRDHDTTTPPAAPPLPGSSRGTPPTPADGRGAHGAPDGPGGPGTPGDDSAPDTPPAPGDAATHTTPQPCRDAGPHGVPRDSGNAGPHGGPQDSGNAGPHGVPRDSGDSGSASALPVPGDSGSAGALPVPGGAGSRGVAWGPGPGRAPGVPPVAGGDRSPSA